MKTHYFDQLPTISKKGMLPVLSLALIFSLNSCNDEDPSYEKEALRLTAEKASLETRLEDAEKNLAAMEAKLKQAKSAVSDASEKITEAKGQIDVDKIKLGFAKAVSDLGAQIEEKHPDYTVESVTFQKMKLPTDYPFSSGVMTTLVSKSSGQKQILYWEGQGNTQGVWRFANKKKPATVATATAATTPSAAANPPAPARPVPATPISPQSNRAIRIPSRTPARADGNTHIIDWGPLR